MLTENAWHFAGVVVEKRKVNPILYEKRRFYTRFAIMPLLFVLRGSSLGPTINRILIFTDRLPIQKRKEAIVKTIKKACSAEVPRGIPCHIYHHRRESNAWIQATDYCCWAVFRKWEKGDPRTYNELRDRLAIPELDVLARGTNFYY